MSRRVAVIACGALALDVRAIARRRGWDVDVHPVPALLHNRPERIPAAVAAEVERLRGRYDRTVLAYGDCGTYGGLDELGLELGLERLEGEHCYDLFARDEVREATRRAAGHLLPHRLPRAHVRAHGRARARPRPPPVAVRGVLPQLHACDLARAAANARQPRRRGQGGGPDRPPARGAAGRQQRARAGARASVLGADAATIPPDASAS